MKKIWMTALCMMMAAASMMAQDEDDGPKGFRKDRLFTGGSISLAFYNNTFLIGGNPVFGYSLTSWLDAGVVLNYNYTSYRDVVSFDDRLRQTVYGGGTFVKLYPVRFLFAQAQFEHNFINQKYIPAGGGPREKYNTSGNSFLIGGGYTSGRFAESGTPHYYVAVLFDIADNDNSPYTDSYGRTIPIIRAGVQVPLFQGGGRYRR